MEIKDNDKHNDKNYNSCEIMSQKLGQRQSKQMHRRKNIMKTDQEDRISGLPDDLIHQILSPLGLKFVVQRTSVLSKRWKLIWTTLPSLKFNEGVTLTNFYRTETVIQR